MPKGEKVWAQSKRTAPPPISKTSCFQENYQLVSYCVQKGEKVVFQNYISKPSWTLRGGSPSGGVLFSQRKSIWNRGRKFQILKMLLKILFIYLWLFAKDFEKNFQNICNTKQVVQAWSKILNKESKPCISSKTINWFNSKQPMHLHYAN